METVTIPEVRKADGLIGAELSGLDLTMPLLKYLFDVGTRPEFITRFRWSPGSIAMWDNRQTWHFAVNDYQGQRRVMHRMLLNGSRPVPAA